MSTDAYPHVYRARLDFLYQSIAVYAVTFVIYLVLHSLGVIGTFTTLWQDPLLLLLCAITMVSVFALIYNFIMRRQIEITPNEIRFTSRARERVIEKKDLRFVQFGSREQPRNRQGIRVVRIGLTQRRRPIRIRLANFERSKALLADLREWAGPIARTGRGRRILRRPAIPGTVPSTPRPGARPSSI
jgi:hypothetical protein